MCGNLVAKVRRVPSSFAFVVLLIAAVCIVSAGCSGPKAEADVMPFAARVDRLDGEVAIDRQNDTQDNGQDQSKMDWGRASVNTPVSVGSRVYVKDESHAAIAFSGRNYVRLNPKTSLDVLSLSQRRTQLALRDGSGIFDVGALAPGELFEVATPNGAVDFQEPGLYQVGIDDRGSTLVSVLSGIAQVVGLAGSGQVGRGQLLTFSGDEAYVSQLDSEVCGHITNDYYSYRYPKTYDGRYADYQRYQDDPYYYDPYRRSASYQYIPDDAEVAGLDDLDDYGDWEDVPDHGHSWRPRVSSNWAPYRDGYWYNDQPLGLTWVSNERWGWAPYHYGRWVNVNQRWYWVPGEIVSRPLYSPALVAFVAFGQDDRVGWVPLGPGDPYVSRYYDRNYQPQYIGSTTYVTQNVNVTNIVNYNVPGAVTVVRTTEFTRVITPGSAEAAGGALLARSRPVADPYAVPGLRELAPNIRAHGSRVQVPETAHQALNRDVVISQAPIAPAVAADTVKALKVKSVPAAEGNRKLQMKNSGQTVTAVQPNGLPASVAAQGGQNQTMSAQERQARIAALTAQAAQGDKSGKREMRQLQDQQGVQEKVDRRATAQAAVAAQQQQQQQLRAERKQAKQQSQQSAVTQQQQKAERKAAQQQNQQPAVTQQQQKQQQKAERKAAQQQRPPPQQQQQQQQKAERKAAQQQNQQPAVTQQQQKQQQKAERKAAQKQKPPPEQQQQQQQQQQQEQKAERKAAQQQQQPPQPQQQQQQQQQKQQQKAERKAAQQQQPPPQQQQQQQQQQQKAERKAAQQQQPPPQQQQQQQQQQQKQEQKAERKAAQQQKPPAQTSPSKADRKAAKNKNGNNNGNPNQ